MTARPNDTGSRRSKDRPRRPVLIELTGAVLALCGTALAVHLWSWPGPFLPAPSLGWVGTLALACSVAAAAIVFVLLQRRQRRYPPSEEQHYRALGFNQLLALLAGLTLWMASNLPLQLLHRWSDPPRATWIESVRMESLGGDGECKRRAWIRSGSDLNGARLCIDFNSELYTRLASKGEVEITGTRSRYGTAVEHYGPVPDTAPANTAQNP